MAAIRRVAVITGASTGIGRAIALRLASDGYNLALNSRYKSRDKLVEVADKAIQMGAKTIVVPGDVSLERDVKNLVDEAVKHLGGVDAMVANAGVFNVTPVSEMTATLWDQMLAVHARGAFLCYKYTIQQMIKQGRGGRIVGASSVFGKRGAANCAHYCAAKFAIRGLTHSTALEVGKYGITVNSYAPGAIDTPLYSDLPEEMKSQNEETLRTQSALGRLGQPEDIANIVSFLLSEKSQYITGQTILVNGGWHVLD